MSGDGEDDWISVPVAAKLLGLELLTVRRLIDRGELAADFALPYPWPKSRRRAIRVRRQDVYAYIEGARAGDTEMTSLESPSNRLLRPLGRLL